LDLEPHRASPGSRRVLRSLGAAVLLGTFAALALAGQEFVKVKRVIDGDTIMLESGERVRLIGVDTPESVDPRRPVERFGKEASAFTRRMAQGKRVHLAYDAMDLFPNFQPITMNCHPDIFTSLLP
jgi:endonuclease YncB( thermonuclease family)